MSRVDGFGDDVSRSLLGRRTVPVSACSNSANLAVVTTDDEMDEEDGWVTVTVTPGDWYHVGKPAATVAQILDARLATPANRSASQ